MEAMGRHVSWPRGAVVAGVSLVGPFTPEQPDEFIWQVPSGYRQGRGAWGGLVLAGIVRAVEVRLRGDDRLAESEVRSVAGVMAGPLLEGPATVRTRVVRSGSSVHSFAVELANSDGVLATSAIVVAASARKTTADIGGEGWQFEADEVVRAALAAGVPDGPALDSGEQGPEFLRQLEVRPLQGFPGEQRPRATIATWLTLRDAPTEGDAAWLAAMTDACWPNALVGTDGTRPLATVSFQAELIADPRELDPREPLLHIGRSLGARSGYVSEARELWSATGQLVARCDQLVAVIK